MTTVQDQGGASLEQVLQAIGPAQSGRILQALLQRGISPEAARKRLSRARSPVTALPGLTLPERARFWFLQEQAGSGRYWTHLLRALDETNSAYGTALHGLHARGGTVPEAEFAVVSGCPAIPRRRQLTARSVKDVLSRIGLVCTVSDPTLGSCVTLTAQAPLRADPYRRKRAVDLAEALILETLAEWSRHLGLVSSGAVSLRRHGTPPEVAGYGWDLCGPSYLSPFRAARSSTGKTMHGFIAADVILGRGLTAAQCGFFFKKCDGVTAQRGVRPVLPLLIADAFENEAFGQGRRRGLILATPRVLFGEDVAEALRSLISILSSVTEQVADPEDVDRVLRTLAKTERASEQLRGPLFELLVAHCLGRSLVIVEVGKNIEHPETGEQANIDVLALQQGVRVIACECRGRRADASVSLGEVQDWFSRQVPRIYAFLQGHPDYRHLRAVFEFWTTGLFTPDAAAFLQSRHDEARRFEVNWKDGPAVERAAKDLRLPAISKILADHFGATVRK